MASKSLRLYLFSLLATLAVGGLAYNAGVLDRFRGGAVSGPAAVPQESTATTPQGASEPVTEAAPEGDAAMDAPYAAEAPVIAPRFDVVRVEPSGEVVIAGSAVPGAGVEVITGTRILGSGEANVDSDFVVVLEEPLAPGDYTIVLRATSPDKIVAMSAETAIVSIPESETGEVLAIVDEPGKPTKLITAPENLDPEIDEPAGEQEPELASAPQAEPQAEAAAPEPAREAPLQTNQPDEQAGEPAGKPGNEQAGSAGSQIVSAPEPAEPVASAPSAAPSAAEELGIAVEAVEIEGDHVFVAGRAEPGRIIRVYANKDLIGEAEASEGGRFLIESTRGLAEGDYIIRADMLAPGSADVVARAAVPFERMPGEMVAAVAPQFTAPAVPIPSQDRADSEKRHVAVAERETGQDAPDGAAMAEPTQEPAPGQGLEAGGTAGGPTNDSGDASASMDVQPKPAIDERPEAPIHEHEQFAEPTTETEASLAELQEPVKAEEESAAPGGQAEKVLPAPTGDGTSEEPEAGSVNPDAEAAPSKNGGATAENVTETQSAPETAVQGQAPLPAEEVTRSHDKVTGEEPEPDRAREPSHPAPDSAPVTETPDDHGPAQEPAVADQTDAATPVESEGAITAPKLEATSGAVIIRRGDTLWQISRRVYGRGVRYTTIYSANQDQINDPDRIWPGQVFDVPAVSQDGKPADLEAISDRLKKAEQDAQ